MTRREIFRLPDGTSTTNPDQYADAWSELGEALEKWFPGYQATAFDPGVVLTRWEEHDDGTSTGVDTISLSTMAANCLLTQKEPERITRYERPTVRRPAKNIRAKVRCPICQRQVQARVPKGGDGSVLLPYQHKDTTNTQCAGAFHLTPGTRRVAGQQAPKKARLRG